MGFTGSFVWVGADVSPSVLGIDADVVKPRPDGGHGPSGWKSWLVTAVPPGVPEGPGLWPDLAKEAGAPVLVATVYDSDSAHMVFCDADGSAWETCLAPPEILVMGFYPGMWPFELWPDEMSREEYDAMVDRAVRAYKDALAAFTARLVTGQAAGERAHRWAVDAGLDPAPAADLTALVQDPVLRPGVALLVERTALALMGRLGLGRA